MVCDFVGTNIVYCHIVFHAVLLPKLLNVSTARAVGTFVEIGAYNGIEHVLLTLEGVPVGVWDPETQEAEEVEFLDADEESE